MKARLVAKAGLGESVECVLEAGREYTIGRSSDTDMPLRHPSVSRRHCKVMLVPPGKWLITDIGSSNGILVNRQRVTTDILKDGDTVQLGMVTLEFRVIAEPSPRPKAQEPSPPAADAPGPPASRPAQAASAASTSAAAMHDTVNVVTPAQCRPGLRRRAAVLVALAIGALAAAGVALWVVRRDRLAPPSAPPTSPTTPAKVALEARARPVRFGKVVKTIPLPDEKGLTPLHVAIKNGQRADAEALLAKGANVNAWDAEGQPNNAPARGLQPLHVAVLEDRKELAELLLAKGAQVNADRGLGSPLHLAAATNNVPLALLLLDRGAAVGALDARRQTPLHYAAQHGQEEVADLLVARGGEIAAWDAEGLTPLHLAAGGGHAAVVKLFLDLGADPNLPNSYGYWTPLHEAARKGHTAVLELLLSRGADINAATKTVTGGGSTPLHEAARAGHADVVKLLLARGADPTLRNAEGRTPQEEAATAGQKDAAELLARAAAKAPR